MSPILRFTAIAALIVVLGQAEAVNLYHPDDYRALTSDRRAHRVGDVLTVQVVENSSASATAGTQTDKTTDAGIRLTSPNRQRNYAFGVDDNFDGNGKIARTGRLLAQLSVAVVAIEPNGDLRVKGDQLLEINGEKQMINLEGRVRPVDIAEGNIVPSNRIADAHITYVGDGVLAENQSKGWLTRLITLFLRLF